MKEKLQTPFYKVTKTSKTKTSKHKNSVGKLLLYTCIKALFPFWPVLQVALPTWRIKRGYNPET
jgi:hypothetical protein